MYILSNAIVSNQNTFEKNGFSNEISPFTLQEDIIHPDYKDIIPAMERRRMSDIIRMSLACAHSCIKQAENMQPEAIIVGTAMGSSQHTKKFMDSIITSQGQLISPTPFIQSLHNTVAGQISLYLNNNGFNSTHTQNALSLEHALYDSMILVEEGIGSVLVGCADEMEGILFNFNSYQGHQKSRQLAGCASFILVSSEIKNASVRISDIQTVFNVENKQVALESFLEKNMKVGGGPDLVLYASFNENLPTELNALETASFVNYTELSGNFLTASGFALSYAIDKIKHGNEPVRSVLIYNNLMESNLGLILIEKV